MAQAPRAGMTGIDAPYEAPPRNAPGSYRSRTSLRRGAGRPAPTAVEPARPARMRPKCTPLLLRSVRTVWERTFDVGKPVDGNTPLANVSRTK
jgi:hypothetical protein